MTKEAEAWIVPAVVLAVIIIGALGIVKVKNELAMTEAYERQAVAQEELVRLLRK